MSYLPRKDHDAPPVPNADRRQHPRQPIVPRLYVILDAAKTDGILNDASETGVALDIVGPAPQEEFIAVDFEMSEIGQRFEARGRIMWRDDATRKVGVHFDDLPEASRSQIRKWLAKKNPAASAATPVATPTPGVQATAPSVPSPISMEPQASSPTPAIPMAPLTPPPLVVLAAPEPPPILKPVGEKSYEVITGSHAESASGVITGSSTIPQSPVASPVPKDETERDRIVQNLLESFSQPPKNAPRDLALKSGAPGMFSAGQTLSSSGGRRWIALTLASGVALVLVLGVLAYRSPARNAATISVSKVGLPPSTAGNGANPGTPSLGGSGPDGSTPAGSSSNSAAGAATPGHSSCVPLGPPSDKVRLFIWAEKETPQPIVDAYLKNLGAVQDVRVVDQPPYDLVLYVNGANVDAKGPEAGYLWSSRVFRPWRCGPGLSQLEQTEVNESLHFVQSAQIDQRVQSEVAYLILHTFESIRAEGQK